MDITREELQIIIQEELKAVLDEKRKKKKKKNLSGKRLVLNLVKSLLFTIGLSVRAPKAKKVAGLIVTLLMERVAINLVAAQRAKRERDILLVDQHPELARSVEEARVGVKKDQRGRRNEPNQRATSTSIKEELESVIR